MLFSLSVTHTKQIKNKTEGLTVLVVFSSKVAVTKVAKTRHDELDIIQYRVDETGNNAYLRVLLEEILHPIRTRD